MMAKPIRALELHYSMILTVFNNGNYTFLSPMELEELLVNVKSTASCQTNTVKFQKQAPWLIFFKRPF